MEQEVVGEGLEKVVVDPQADRFDGGVRIGCVSGNNDGAHVGLDLLDGPQRVDAVHPRHAYVADHDFERLGSADSDGLLTAIGRGDRVA